MERIRPGLFKKRVRIGRSLASICLVLFSVVLVSCLAPSPYVQKEPAKGIYHLVKKGETLRSIARAYNVKAKELAEANNINPPGLIHEGSVLFIPDANKVIDDVITSVKKTDTEAKAATKASSAAKVKSPQENNNGKNIKSAAEDTGNSGKKPLPLVAVPEKEKVAKLTPREGVPAIKSTPSLEPADEKKLENKSKSALEEKEENKFGKKRFIWPVRGSVKTRFGIQPNKTYHNWIKIVSVAGTQVKAAAAGMVIFSAQLKDYGETIIVRHENSFATVYTHLKKRYVKIDQKIKKGNVIAVIGEKDEAGDVYMNFEVRLNGKARNPLFFLPE
ncbi:MAG: peptidoglycan DD-metalloendopeptidase family protein [Smithellaceae bacterium]